MVSPSSLENAIQTILLSGSVISNPEVAGFRVVLGTAVQVTFLACSARRHWASRTLTGAVPRATLPSTFARRNSSRMLSGPALVLF